MTDEELLPPIARWECLSCNRTHTDECPLAAEPGDEYDGECPHCDTHTKMKVLKIEEEI